MPSRCTFRLDAANPRISRVALPAICAALFVVSCAAPEVRPSAGERKAVPASQTSDFPERAAGEELSPLPLEMEQFLRTRFEDARRDFTRRNYLRAYRVAEAILVIAPQISFREELRQFRRNAEGRYLSGSVLTVSFNPPAGDTSFPRRKLTGELVIENVSTNTVTIGKPGSACVIGQLRVTASEVYPDGSERSNTQTQVLKVPSGFELTPAASRSLEVRCDAAPAFENPIVQLFLVDGQLLPTELASEGKTFTRGVPFLRAVVTLLAEDLAEIPKEPLRHFRIALLAGDTRRLIAATALLAREIREGGSEGASLRGRLVEELVGSLDSQLPEFRAAVLRLLENLTGEHFASKEEWTAWMNRGGKQRALGE